MGTSTGQHTKAVIFTCNAPDGCGTVFKVTAGGTLTKLHNFESTDGSHPDAGLVQATDGSFYGTTGNGGANGFGGTVFKITPGGTLTTLYSFCAQTDCTDGANLQGGLVQATDGNFYGTTNIGGASNSCNSGCGTVFKITPGGTLTTLHRLDFTDGENPYAGLVQATDGNFYGTTSQGGTPSGGCCGTVFSLSVGLVPFVETQPTSGNTGTPVTILGTNLMGATGVTFNGTAAAFKVVSASEITTTVPAGATTGLVQVTGTPTGTLSSNATFQITTPVQFVPVPPCRLVDTRTKNGGSGPIQGGTFESFNLPQAAQQSKGCPTLDLFSAAAYSLNVTVVPQVPLGYLTVWPTGEIMLGISTMNSLDGRVKANAAIVPSGSNAVSVFASNTTDVVLDIDGYFVQANPSTLAFYPLPPCRVVDTRDSSKPPNLGPPYLQGQMARDFPVLSSPCFQGVSSPAAYSFNVTVQPKGGQPLGYLTVWPAGQPQPVVSTLNAPTGTVVANAAIVPAGMGGGDIEVFASNDTDMKIDVNGYFAAPGQNGLSLYAVAPCRVLDTRHVGNKQPFSGELTVDVEGSACAPPGTAQAYVFNATVVPPGPLGYLTLWPDLGNQPAVSTLNSLDGAITSNMAIVPTSNGKIDAYASNLTQLILDISSYFAP